MVCRGCGAELPASAKFCAECGLPQQAACASCGAALPPNARFCLECGTPTSTTFPASAEPPAATAAPTAPVAERRMCSVLFADLVGFTPLSESRDPEEVRELLSRYFDAARTVIGRYGGVVEKFIGDAVMAVWGTPVAAEGDAERAVRAALDVVDTVAALGAEIGVPGLAARAGVVTGEVAVTVGAQQEGMVAGDAVNTAARVQAVATPGTVLVDAATRRSATAAIGFDDAGEHPLKGKAEPEQLWRATRVLAGVGGAQRIDGLEAPLIGRDAEMRTIKELFHAAVDRRTPRLVVVTGAPGVGKSRLGWEFEKYVDGLAQIARWHRGRCLSYGEGVAFWALAQAVRQRLGIAEDDATEVAAVKLADGLAEIIPDPAEREFVALRIGRLLGVPVGAEDDGRALGREELFAGWRVFFERLAAVRPVIWLIEDAQYADASLLDFVDHLIDWVRELPIFVMLLARAELTESRSGLGVGRNRTLLTLDPLDTTSMDRLVDALVPGMPDGSRTAITARAQGVPLFAVETIRSLVDRDVVQPVDGVYRLVGQVGELAVPESLHGLLASRLDALPAKYRGLVADAAVLGSSFPAEALVAISDQDEATVRAGLAEFLRREVLEVSSDRLSPERGSYQFAQQLVRQVAYDTLSRRDRKARHLRVAAHLRSAFADDGEEVADVIARHYGDALAAVPDDSDVEKIRDQVVAMSVRAAERATRTGAAAAASDAYARAAALAETGDAVRAADWWQRAARAASLGGNPAVAVTQARQAEQLYRSAGDTRAAAAATAVVGRALQLLGRFAEARDELTAAVAVLREPPDRDTVAALTELATIETFDGTPAAEQVVDEMLRLTEALDLDDNQLALALVIAGLYYAQSDRVKFAIALLREGVRLAEHTNDRFVLGRALINLSDTLSGFDPAAARAAAERGAEVLRQIGARNHLGFAMANLLEVLMVTGEWNLIETLLDQAMGADGLDDQEVMIAWATLHAGFRGRAELARTRLAGISRFRETEDPQDRATLAVAEAVTAYAAGDDREVLRHAKSALAFVDRLGVKPDNMRWAWLMAARAAQDLGDTSTLRELLALVDAHPVGHLPIVLRSDADLVRASLCAADDPETAERLRDRAIAALRRIPAPFHLAFGLLDRGRDADITEAAEIAERLGAAPLAARVRAATRTR